MSHEDPYRPNPGRDRGAYTPPTEDDLPFDRAGYDPRRGPGGPAGGGGGKAPPLTLIISVVVLLAIIVAVLVMKPWESASPDKAPPAVGTPVGDIKVEPPVDAQPVDPEAGIDVYSAGEPTTTPPTFVPPPEAVQPRPQPQPETAPPPVRPAPSPARTEPAAPPPAAGGTSGVQIGAFSTPAIAESQYNQIVGRYPSLTRGGSRRVQEVTSSSGSTLYRTTVTGLSREQATGLCTAIKSAGGDCIVR
ncbi:SPOR domain-containing protein [Brevundimonas sp. M20]|uniref:SPOR domain-containing protein n=1 Tax=Brevundimonas sp. M20 TaxID=2591463 RepID=UPI001147785A|nr:SPOR domain-containing protein [Brevundimonas sp. M20]QDH74074.1 SPOR domain-containing protein [Brevundimonas sp. M20]